MFFPHQRQVLTASQNSRKLIQRATREKLFFFLFHFFLFPSTNVSVKRGVSMLVMSRFISRSVDSLLAGNSKSLISYCIPASGFIIASTETCLLFFGERKNIGQTHFGDKCSCDGIVSVTTM